MKIWISEHSVTAGRFQKSNLQNIQKILIGCNCNMMLDSGNFPYIYIHFSIFHIPLYLILLFPMLFCLLPSFSHFDHKPYLYLNLFNGRMKKTCFSHLFQKEPNSKAGFLTTIGCQNEGGTWLNLTVSIFSSVHWSIHCLFNSS